MHRRILFASLAILLVVDLVCCNEHRNYDDGQATVRHDQPVYPPPGVAPVYTPPPSPPPPPPPPGEYPPGSAYQPEDIGCYVIVFDRKNFDSNHDSGKILGPVSWPDLKQLHRSGKKGWGDAIESIIVGPRARVIFFRDKDFKGTSVAFGPGSRVSDLGKTPLGNNRADALIIEAIP